MADWVYAFDGSPFEGKVPNRKLAVPIFGEEVNGITTTIEVTASPGDEDWDNVLHAWMFIAEGCVPAEEYSEQEVREGASPFVEGGPGSGHWGHAGVPGKRGGSAPSTSGGGSPEDREFISATSSGAKSSSSKLGGGVTTTKLTYYEGNGSGVEKRAVDADGMHQGYSEVGAYEVAQMLGYDDLVPATVWVKDGKGTSQRFVPGAKTGWEYGREGLEKAVQANDMRVRGTLLLDAIIGNQDRHRGNYVFDRSGKLFAIDHGHAKWSEWEWEIDDFGGRLGEVSGYYRGFTLTSGELQRLTSLNEVGFISRLTSARVPRQLAIDAWDNVQQIIENDGVIQP